MKNSNETIGNRTRDLPRAPTLCQMRLNEINIDHVNKRDTVDRSYCYFTNLLTINILQFSVSIGDQAPFYKVFKGGGETVSLQSC